MEVDRFTSRIRSFCGVKILLLAVPNQSRPNNSFQMIFYLCMYVCRYVCHTNLKLRLHMLEQVTEITELEKRPFKVKSLRSTF